MSAWEYDAPTTMLESDPLEEPCFGPAGRLRQNGDVDLLLIRQVIIPKFMAAGIYQTYSSEPKVVDYRFQQIFNASKCIGNVDWLVG